MKVSVLWVALQKAQLLGKCAGRFPFGFLYRPQLSEVEVRVSNRIHFRSTRAVVRTKDVLEHLPC